MTCPVAGPVSFVDTRNNKREGKLLLKPVQTVINGVPFGRPYQAPFAVRDFMAFLNEAGIETRPIIAGTSINGPITAANAAPELMPNTATATAIANSKLLLAAVKERVVVLE